MYGQLVGRVGIRFVTAGAVCSSYVVSNCQNTIFVRIHTHARTHAHPSPNISRNWNFQCISCILQPLSGAKCGDNIENSKLCMHNSRRVSQLQVKPLQMFNISQISTKPTPLYSLQMICSDIRFKKNGGVLLTECIFSQSYTKFETQTRPKQGDVLLTEGARISERIRYNSSIISVGFRG